MSEEVTVNSEQLSVINEDPAQPEAEDAAMPQFEKRVPVSEAIRYRKRAQAAEKELSQLKEQLEQQGGEVAELKEQVQALTADSQSDRSNQDPPFGAAGSEAAQAVKTQGVKESRTTGARSLLHEAARRAAGTGHRADVQAYLRLRRNYV